jgi:MFS family permease
MTASQPGQGKGNRATRVYLYFAPLMLLVVLATPRTPLVNISVSFMLKNQLHASPSEVALFLFLTALPTYLSFPFGLARDRWNPFGLRDRGFLLLFAPVTALVYACMAHSGLSFMGLFAGMLMAEVTFQFVAAAYNGLMALVAQEQLMSGRLASLLGMIAMLPAVAGALASGWLVEHVTPGHTFLVVAALTLGVALVGMWKPRAVFEHAYDQPVARGADLLGDVRRLLRHKAIYPSLLINFLAQFNPGMGTPMQYYITDRLHAPDGVYGYYSAIFAASFIPVFLLYGWLCKRARLRTLLWLGTFILIPQTVPLALIHTGGQALLLAVPLGLMGGLAVAAYNDLAMRSCPPGLQGTFMMLVTGVIFLSNSGSNVLGAAIYSASPSRGFLYDVIATVMFTAAILPVLKLIPRDLIVTSDGQSQPGRVSRS